MSNPIAYDHSLYYDDLQIGDTYVTPSRTITEADVMLFAGLTGDYVELHTSRAYAEKSRWGKPIACSRAASSLRLSRTTSKTPRRSFSATRSIT